MFDWSRGSLLKAMQLAGVPDASYDPWLKGFAYAWLQAVLSFSEGAKVLEVGCSATPHYLEKLRSRYKIEAHGLDKKDPKSRDGWGLDEKSGQMYPELILHNGFAGEEVCPSDFFDAVISVSSIEHIYDSAKPINARDMYPHYRALKDMARMVKPGGIIAFTYDFTLCFPHNAGWSPVADYDFLLTLGLVPCCPQKDPEGEIFIYNHSDTLFVQPDGILNLFDNYFRIAIMCFAFRKPALRKGLVQYKPNKRIAHILEGVPEEYKRTALTHPHVSRLRSTVKAILPRPIWNVLRRVKHALLSPPRN
jgi:SAM-dependent methyltransferase